MVTPIEQIKEDWNVTLREISRRLLAHLISREQAKDARSRTARLDKTTLGTKFPSIIK